MKFNPKADDVYREACSIAGRMTAAVLATGIPLDVDKQKQLAAVAVQIAAHVLTSLRESIE